MRFGTAENEPAKMLQNFAKLSANNLPILPILPMLPILLTRYDLGHVAGRGAGEVVVAHRDRGASEQLHGVVVEADARPSLAWVVQSL